jgi:hypothetical protein
MPEIKRHSIASSKPAGLFGGLFRGRSGFRIHGPGDHRALRRCADGAVRPAAIGTARTRRLIALHPEKWRGRLRHRGKPFALNHFPSVEFRSRIRRNALDMSALSAERPSGKRMDRSWI